MAVQPNPPAYARKAKLQAVETFADAESTTGVIVALPADPGAIAVEGGDPAGELHVTVKYLGDAADLDDDKLTAVQSAVMAAVAGIDPIEATFGGATVFPDNDGDGTQAVAVQVQHERFSEMHRRLCDDLDEIVGPDTWPDYVPHLTLGYSPVGEPGALLDAAMALAGEPVTFDRLAVWIAGEATEYRFQTADDSSDSDEETDMATTAASTPETTQRVSLIVDRATFAVDDTGATWEGLLCPEGVESADGRMIAEGAIQDWRDLPLPLMFMDHNPEGMSVGHAGAVYCGDIAWVERRGSEVWGGGPFDPGDAGQELARIVARRGKFGVSVDLAVKPEDVEWILPDGVPAGSSDEDVWDAAEIMVVLKATLLGATACPFPAFATAQITLVSGAAMMSDDDDALVAAGVWRIQVVTPFVDEDGALVASAAPATVIPVDPPIEWFARPQVDRFTPLMVTAEGRIFGHAFSWTDVHIGFAGQRIHPPRSRCNYAGFRTGSTLSAEGSTLRTGVIAMVSDHACADASCRLSAADAAKYYADNATGVADVVAYDDEWGILIAGAVRPDATPAEVRRLRGSAISPDWRMIDGHLECVAMLAVNYPGFRSLVASGHVVVRYDGNLVPLAMVASVGPPATDLEIEVASLRSELDGLKASLRPIRRAHAAALISV